jgi:hypothetical protein
MIHPVRKKKHQYALSLFCLLIPKLLIGSTLTNWVCNATDGDKKTWSINHTYQRAAMGLAIDACKKQSRVPLTCKMRESNCDYFINGISTKPMWQCQALDRKGEPWKGLLKPEREEAALSAKAICKENSAIPDTCYSYVFTCINIQEK